MLLAIDVGNSNTVFAAMVGPEVQGRYRTQTLRQPDAAGAYTAALEAFFAAEGLRAADFDGAILSSVVPEADGALTEAVAAVTQLSCLRVTPSLRTDMPILLEHPETLAADIICGCVGAMRLVKPPVAVVDMGTATTIVVLDKDGAYRGGVIAAGVKVALSALTAGTSLLPDTHISAPGKIIATETAESLLGGAVYGAAAMADGVVERMEQELGYPLATVVTGGLGGVVAPYCRRSVTYDADLLFRGMAALYEMNT